MPLIAYNLTAAPLAVPALSLARFGAGFAYPVSGAAGTRGANPVIVTEELNGLSGADYIALQAQVAAGSVQYVWTGQPEYATGTLQTVAPGQSSAPQALSGAGAIDLVTRTTLFTSTAAGNALSLANGLFAGQRKTVFYTAEAAGADTGVITPATPGNFATATVNAVKDAVEFEWSGAAWNVVGWSGTVTFT